MKNTKLFNFTKTLYIIFTICTIILLWAVYKDFDNHWIFKFGIAYVILALFLLTYIPCLTIFNLKKFSQKEIMKKMLKFIKLLIIFTSLNFCFDFFIRHSEIDGFRIFSNALGLSFGISFLDVIFLNEKKNKSGRMG